MQYNKISKISISVILTMFVLGLLAFGSIGAAQGAGVDDALKGLNDTSEESGLSTSGTAPTVASLIGKIVGAALQFVGVAFLLLMIYGGLIWMLARGNDSEVSKAKDIIQAAIIGLVIVTAAYAITAYIGTVLVN